MGPPHRTDRSRGRVLLLRPRSLANAGSGDTGIRRPAATVRSSAPLAPRARPGHRPAIRRSTTATYRPIPIAQAKTMAAHDRSKLRNAEYVAMYWPRLARGAAKYSPTTAPIVASVAASRNAVKTYGSAVRHAQLPEHLRLRRGHRAKELQGRRIDIRQPADRVDHDREEAQGRRDHRLGQLLIQPEPVVEQRREGEDRDRAGRDRERHQRVLHRPVAGRDRPDDDPGAWRR